MTLKPARTVSGERATRARCARRIVWLLGLAAVGAGVTSTDAPQSPSDTPRAAFNSGTELLRKGKLREAEALLESALASQVARVQSPALYNLGHVRFAQGLEELKKELAAGPATARGRVAGQLGDSALTAAEEALYGNDIQAMVAAYMNGRGARKELRAATEAVRRALEAHRAALSRWQRASGDFKSALELNPRDADARHNADSVDRNIAKLVDSLRQLQQMQNNLGAKCRNLGDKIKQLKGRIPAPNMPPGAAGDDEEDEDSPLGAQPDPKEQVGREGQEMSLTPEQAGWLLEGFKLDNERRLPMGQNETNNTPERRRRPW